MNFTDKDNEYRLQAMNRKQAKREKKAYEIDPNDFEAKERVMPKMSEGFREWLTGIGEREFENQKRHNERLQSDFPETKRHPMDELIRSGEFDGSVGNYALNQALYKTHFSDEETMKRRKAKDEEPQHPMNEILMNAIKELREND